MSFWMGIALAQVVALPGYLLVRLLRLDREGLLQTAFLSFGASLVLNHLLVVLLVVMGAYQRPVLVGVLAVECALLAWLLRRRAPRVAPAPATVPHPWLLAAALAAAGWAAVRVPANFTHVFEKWDAVLSWNRWANDWAAGELPFWIAHYPQLVPTTWSLFYVFQGAPVEFAARGMMALFPLAIVLVFVDLGLRRREAEPLLAAVIVTVLLATMLGPWLGAGLSDVPVAFFGLLALHPLQRGPLGEDRRADAAWLAMATLAAVGCALTKQTGLWVAGLLPVFLVLRLGGLAALREPRWRKALFAMGAGLFAGIVPWYAWAQYRIVLGMERSELPHITGTVHRGANALERLAHALHHLDEALTPWGLVTLAILVLLSLFRPSVRWTTLLMSVPFTAVWALLASYSIRNLALALPFVALSAAHGAGWLAEQAARRGLSPGRPPGTDALARALSLAMGGVARYGAAALGVALLACVALALVRFDDERIAAAHDARLALVGKAELNEAILAFQREHGFDGPILTNYRWAEGLPGLRERIFINRGAPAHEVWPFQGTQAAFERIVRENGIRYILVTVPIASQSVEAHLREAVASGRYVIVFETPKGALLRVAK